MFGILWRIRKTFFPPASRRQPCWPACKPSTPPSTKRSARSTAAQSLAAIASQLAGAETAIALALSSGGPLTGIDLTAVERLIQTSQATAKAAEATHAAEASSQALHNLATADAATRATVTDLADDLYKHRIFDDNLRFTSPADEDAYRARDAERQRLIAEELAHHTPEGNLNAAMHEAGQMADAGTHGASTNSAFAPRWQHLVETIQQQREAMRAAGKSTEDADRQLRDELRRSLHGVPPEQLERILAAPDPLQAAGPFVTAAGLGQLEKILPPAVVAERQQHSDAPSTVTQTRLAGIGNLVLDAVQPDDTGHGLPDQPRGPGDRPAGRVTP